MKLPLIFQNTDVFESLVLLCCLMCVSITIMMIVGQSDPHTFMFFFF